MTEVFEVEGLLGEGRTVPLWRTSPKSKLHTSQGCAGRGSERVWLTVTEVEDRPGMVCSHCGGVAQWDWLADAGRRELERGVC